MKKKMFAGLLAVLMLLSLTACGGKDSLPPGGVAPDEDIPNQEIDPEWEAQQEQKYEMEQYGLDLSMYDDHSEWSYDRMWVHKTEESWDAVKGYYGYIDREGNLVGEWHEEKTNENSFEDEEFLDYDLTTAPCLVPGDYQGEFVAMLCGRSGSTGAGAYVEIFDLHGNSIVRFHPNFRTYSYRTDELMLNDFARKLSEDVLFWDYDWGEVHISWIEAGQFFDREIEDAPYSAYLITDKINGYYPYLNCYKGESDFGLIAENGDHVFHGEMDYEVTKIVPAAEGEVVSIYFVGKDERNYVVEMDFDGNWLTEPELVS